MAAMASASHFESKLLQALFRTPTRNNTSSFQRVNTSLHPRNYSTLPVKKRESEFGGSHDPRRSTAAEPYGEVDRASPRTNTINQSRVSRIPKYDSKTTERKSDHRKTYKGTIFGLKGRGSRTWTPSSSHRTDDMGTDRTFVRERDQRKPYSHSKPSTSSLDSSEPFGHHHKSPLQSGERKATATTPAVRAKRDPWQIQKTALKQKFGEEGWNPRKKLSPDAQEGIRTLHEQDPTKYSTAVLAEHFKVSAEAIRRILKSKWQVTPEKMEERRERWAKRHDRIWDQQAELGLKPQRKSATKKEDPDQFGIDLEKRRMLGEDI